MNKHEVKTMGKILFGMLIALSFILIGGAAFTIISPDTIQMAVVELDSVLFALPRFATIECEISPTTFDAYTAWLPIDKEGIIITRCPGANCKIMIEHSWPETFPEVYDGIFINIGGTRADNSPEYIAIGAADNVRYSNYLQADSPHTIWNYQQGSSVFLQYAELGYANKFSAGQTGAKWRFAYKPLRLRIRNGMGFVSYQEGDCSLLGFDNLVLKADVRDNEASSPIKCTGNACELGGVINFVDFWEKTDIFSGGLVDYAGKQMFCASGLPSSHIYEVGSMIVDGQEILYPLRVFESVDCCKDGIIVGNKICKDFKWISITEEEPGEIQCISDMECIGSGTQWITEYDNPLKQNIWGCRYSFCKIVDTRIVECSEIAPLCPNGKVCKQGECITEEADVTSARSLCEQNPDYVWIEKETSSFFGLNKVAESYCKLRFNWIPIYILGFGFLLLIITLIIGSAIKGKK